MPQIFRKYIKKQHHNSIPSIKFKTNFTNCILESFLKRGYQQTENQDWDIVWSEKDNIQEIYQKRLQPNQRVNHFRNYYELCRKDLIIRNLKKHKKWLQRENRAQQASSYNFYPQTFILPNEYVIFADQFKKIQTDNKNVWIMKPIGKSQGKGIFLFNKLSQVAQWQAYSAQNYIVQRYINQPLLIGGKKFDIRIYVLVTSYSPLTLYLYRQGFARFTHCRYDESKIQNSQMHLTNVAIQKQAQGYDQNIGGKWYLDKLKKYLLSRYGSKIDTSFFKIQQIIIRTLQAMVKIMANDRQNAFQLYGFDILLDSKLEPWLIQVNGSPSMTANTSTDSVMKLNLLDDTLYVLDQQKFLQGSEEQIGGFDLIYKKKAVNQTQKISFLGCQNNRSQNLKKIAKNNSVRLNTQYANKKKGQDKKLTPQSNLTSFNNTSNNPMKKRIISRRTTKINNKDLLVKPKRKDQNQIHV